MKRHPIVTFTINRCNNLISSETKLSVTRMDYIELSLILFLCQSLTITIITCASHRKNEQVSSNGTLRANNDLLNKLLPEMMKADPSLDFLATMVNSAPDLQALRNLQMQRKKQSQSRSNSHDSILSPVQEDPSQLPSTLESLAALSSLASSLPGLSALPSLDSMTKLLHPLSNIRTQYSSQYSMLKDPDIGRSCEELITSRGFANENHYVKVKDGTILHLFRIINSHAQAVLGAKNLHPVLLNHGMFVSCASWLNNSPGEKIAPWVNKHRPLVSGNNLATYLSNQGYDVWLNNNRGNRYSTNHSKLNPEKDDVFWDFSIDEIIMQDTPAVIDYIRKVTEKDKITIIGLSLGSSQTFGLLSAKPEYANYIDLFIAMAPAVYFGHIKGPFSYLTKSDIVKELVKQYHGKFAAIDKRMMNSLKFTCDNPVTRVLCSMGFDSLTGLNIQQFNNSRLFVYLSHSDFVSVKMLNHLLQMIESGIIQFYDHGHNKNLLEYGSPKPPKYPLSKITFDKIVLVSGLGDYCTSPEDVHQLRKKLRDKILIDYIVKDPKWNHMDYVYGIDAWGYVNKFVVETIDEYTKKKKVRSEVFT